MINFILYLYIFIMLFCLALVGVRCFIVGANDVGATALRRSGSIRDGILSPRGIQVGATDKLSRRAVRSDGVLLGNVSGREANI